MPEYQLTSRARRDLLEITDYGIQRFGRRNAERYLRRIGQRLVQLAEEPFQVQEVAHLAPGVRRAVVGSHSIYFRVQRGGILVLRILGRQDPAAAFAP